MSDNETTKIISKKQYNNSFKVSNLKELIKLSNSRKRE